MWRILIVTVLLAGLLAVTPASPAVAAGVVGDGDPGSCDEDALDAALLDGGPVTFDCGNDAHTIPLTSQKIIAANTQIDGGGLITLDGQSTTRIFVVNVGSSLELSNITLSRGRANAGGAIYNNGTLTVTNSILRDSFAFDPPFGGGGIYNDNSGTLTLTNSTLSGNSASDGGGIYNAFGTLALTNSTLSGNSATGTGGGGIYNFGGPATLTLTNSTLLDNEANIWGGGIVNDGALTLTNSTFSGNRAEFGGGIYNDGTATLTNSTLSGNSGRFGGGGIYNDGRATLAATIIAYSPEGGNCAQIPVTSLGGNISDDTTCNLNQTSDRNNTDPLLLPLQDNGGPTATHQPAADSPAIDAIAPANCPSATDQRDVARPQGVACDSGSVEVRPGATYLLCANYYTGAVTSPLSGGCGAGRVELAVPGNLSFCVNSWTGQLTYAFGQPCAPPRRTHTLPDDGDLLTCVSVYTGVNRWVAAHSQCTAYELPNTIPERL